MQQTKPLSQRIVEVLAAVLGILGAGLLASNTSIAGWGWVSFLASNACWIWFSRGERHWWLLLQHVAFTGTSLWGIWNWLLAG